MTEPRDLFRVYDDVGADGYPPEWHATIKHLVREQAGHRCVRCHHPYRNGAHGSGEWTPCDERCTHRGPLRFLDLERGDETWTHVQRGAAGPFGARYAVEAQWRILTVHHLNGAKPDCRWWNLAALCQRCHLTIQGKVQLHRIWPWEHGEWFKPYAAGWYAHAYLGEDLARDDVAARLDELLALERVA